MTDSEVIATFMQVKPAGKLVYRFALHHHRWWSWSGQKWVPRGLTLNECREVEARLTDEQWGVYNLTLAELLQSPERHFARGLLHASVEQKITALAAVLRPLVAAEEQKTQR